MGNTLIGIEKATQWLARNKFIESEFLGESENVKAESYKGALLYSASREVPGTIYEAVIDPSHLLNFGFTGDHIAVCKDNKIVDTGKNLNLLNYPVRFSGAIRHAVLKRQLRAAPLLQSSHQNREESLHSTIITFSELTGEGLNRYVANAVFFSKAIRFSAGGEGGDE